MWKTRTLHAQKGNRSLIGCRNYDKQIKPEHLAIRVRWALYLSSLLARTVYLHVFRCYTAVNFKICIILQPPSLVTKMLTAKKHAQRQ